MKVKIFVIAVLWLLSGFFSAAAQTGPCQCADFKDMLYRIKEANAAIREYQRQIQHYDALEKTGTSPVMFTLDEYRSNLQPAIQTVLNDVRISEPPPLPKSATAKTDQHSCNTIVSGGSSCLQEAIRRHESFHSNTCSVRRPSPANPLSDYREGMKMKEVAEEEINAYTLEKAYLASELAKLPDKCKPPNWYLTYTVQVRYKTPPSNSAPSRFENWKKWEIDHTYSVADLELTPTTPIPPWKIAWSHQPPLVSPTSFLIPFNIEIRDKLVDYGYEECKGDPLDYIMMSETTKTWIGNGQDKAANLFRFDADFANKTYNVQISIDPKMNNVKPVKYDSQTNWERTLLKPLTGSDTQPTQMLSFQAMGLPTVKGLLEKGKINHAAVRPLEITLDTVTFDSGWVRADGVSLPKFPELKGKLEVRIYYRLTKFPT